VGRLDLPIVPATVSSVDERAFSELMNRDELKEVLREERIAQDAKLVEQLFSEIAKEGKACYGMAASRDAALAGAVDLLLLTDGCLLKAREDGTDKELDVLMKQVERTKGQVHILYSEHEPGKRLDGLGGIAARLRFKIGI
jgi:protein pelota